MIQDLPFQQDRPVQALGDDLFYGVRMDLDPHLIPAGYCAYAKNMRFTEGKPRPRGGTAIVPWLNKLVNGVLSPWGEIHGIGTFRDPVTKTRYVLIAADGGVYYTLSANTPQPLGLPAGVTLAGRVRFVQAYNRMLLLRGPDAAPLEMTSVLNGFTEIDQSAITDDAGTLPLPLTWEAIYAADRVFAVNDDDEIAYSDLLDYTRYRVEQEFQVNPGAEDKLVTIAMFGTATMVAAKERSIHRIDNVYGNLAAVKQTEITRRYGIVAARSLVDCGTDIVWLCQEGMASLTLTTQNEVQAANGVQSGNNRMFSDPIRPLIQQINWNYAQNAAGVFWKGRLYMAVPYRDAEILGPELVPTQSSPPDYNNQIPVVLGQTYRWEKENSIQLTNGTNVYTDSVDFVAASNEITITMSLIVPLIDSLRRVYYGVNNAVFVYDFNSGQGAWSGYDQGDELGIQDWIKVDFDGDEWLAYAGYDGFVKLYEYGEEDQLSRPYTDLEIISIPTDVDTIQVNGGTLVTVAAGTSDNTAILLARSGNAPVEYVRQNLWTDSGGKYGYCPHPPYWSAPNTFPSPIPYGVRFYSTNGEFPVIVVTATDATDWKVTVRSMNPIETELRTRAYVLPDREVAGISRVLLDVKTWRPCYTARLLLPGAFASQTLAEDQTRDRCAYINPETTDFDATNEHLDWATPGREDYSIVIEGEGNPTELHESDGIIGEQYQERRFAFNIEATRARTVQLELTNTQGAIELISVRFDSGADESRNEEN
jgi:hypothetical protein